MTIFIIENVSHPFEKWTLRNRQGDPIKARIEDKDFLQGCETGHYDPYDGMKIRALYERTEDIIRIQQVQLVG